MAKQKLTSVQQRISDLEEQRLFNTASKEVQELRIRTLEMAYRFMTCDGLVDGEYIPSIRKIKEAATELENHITKGF